MRLSDELRLVLLEVESFDDDDPEWRSGADEHAYLHHVWSQLGHRRVSENWLAEEVVDALLPVFEQLLKDGQAPKGGWRPVADPLVDGRPAPDMLVLVKSIGLGKQVMPDGTKVNGIASALQVMFADQIEDDLVGMERRWRDAGNYELKKRRQTRRDRRERIDPPFTPPAVKDPRKMT